MSGDPQAAIPMLRRAMKATDPSLAIRNVRSMNDVVGLSLAPRRFALALAASFAVVALMLAAVGIYGVLAYMVTTRTREFGVRIALGATAGSVLVLVVRQGLGWSLLGLVLGIRRCARRRPAARRDVVWCDAARPVDISVSRARIGGRRRGGVHRARRESDEGRSAHEHARGIGPRGHPEEARAKRRATEGSLSRQGS
jgi:hypothetical protein